MLAGVVVVTFRYGEKVNDSIVDSLQCFGLFWELISELSDDTALEGGIVGEDGPIGATELDKRLSHPEARVISREV